MTKWQLFSALANGTRITIDQKECGRKSITGLIMGIAMEDGSHKCWNVTIAGVDCRGGLSEMVTVFVRTID